MSSEVKLPPAFISQMKSILGEEFSAFIAALETPAPVSVHWNPLKIKKWQENSNGVKWYNKGVYLDQRPSFTMDPSFHAGAYYVQEASSMFTAFAAQQLSDGDRPLKVLDLCAAPGGKSTLLASLLPPGSWLLSNEVIRSRYQILRYNLDKWGHPNTFSSQHDPEDFLPLAGFFDLVLVDAPCSGEGLFRKDPAARSEWSPESVERCAARQGRILRAAEKLVAPGGLLLYSTCTYNTQENDQNARWLLDNFALDFLPLELPADWQISERSPGYQLYPHRVEGEGFYLAAFRQKADHRVRSKVRPFKKLRPVPDKLSRSISRWVSHAAPIAWFSTPQEHWRAIPQGQLEDAQILAAALHRLEVGVPAGHFKGKNWIPSPEWALHHWCSATVPTVALDRSTAISYLRKEAPPLPDLPKGWAAVTYEGLKLGWIKGLGHRYNNYYPKHWRIRMQPKK